MVSYSQLPYRYGIGINTYCLLTPYRTLQYVRYKYLLKAHPLAGGTLLHETIMQSLCTPYHTAKLAREAAKKLVDNIAKAVLTHIFIGHTAADLSDKEMEVTLCASHFDHIWFHFHLPNH